VEVTTPTKWRRGLRELRELPPLEEAPPDPPRRRFEDQLRQAAQAQAERKARQRARVNVEPFSPAGTLKVPEGVKPVRQSNPGVRGRVKKKTVLCEKPSAQDPGQTKGVKSGTPCLVHPTDGPYAYVELYVIGAAKKKEKEKEKETKKGEEEEEISPGQLHVTDRGYVLAQHVQPLQRWERTKRPLFVGKPSPADIEQGALGDCYLLSTLISIADANPDAIENMMRDDGDTVTVRLFDKDMSDPDKPRFVEKYVSVEKSTLQGQGVRGFLAGAGSERAGDSLWVQILEKAYTTHVGKTPDELAGGAKAEKSRSLAGMASGWSNDSFEALLGRPAQRKAMPGRRQFGERLNTALKVPRFLFTEESEGRVRKGLARLTVKDQGVPSPVVLPGEFIDRVVGCLRANSPFEQAEDLKQALQTAGLCDTNGAVVPGGWDTANGPRPPTPNELFNPILVACISKDVSSVEPLKQSAAYTKIKALDDDPLCAEVRREDLAELFASPEFQRLLPTTQEYLRSNLEAEFPGKRFTGQYSRHQSALWEEIGQGLENNSLMCLGTPQFVGRKSEGRGHSAGEEKSKGLAGTHSYAVLGVYEPAPGEPGYVKPKEGGQPIRYLRLRNPWGNYGRVYTEQKGTKGESRPHGAKATKEGEFLLELSDVNKRFSSFSVTDPLVLPFGPEQHKKLREEIDRLCDLTHAFKKDRDGLFQAACKVGECSGLTAAVEYVAGELGANLEYERRLCDFVAVRLEETEAAALYHQAVRVLYNSGLEEAERFVESHVQDKGRLKARPESGDEGTNSLREFLSGLRVSPAVSEYDIFNRACEIEAKEGLDAAKAYAEQFAIPPEEPAPPRWQATKAGPGRQARLGIAGGRGEEGRAAEVIDADAVRARLTEMREQATAELKLWEQALAGEESEASDGEIKEARAAVLERLTWLADHVNGLLAAKQGAGLSRGELVAVLSDFQKRAAEDNVLNASDQFSASLSLSPRTIVMAAAGVLGK
jgi:Calpain family cysteine protease